MNPINITISIDPDSIVTAIDEAKDLQNNDKVFAALSKVAGPKEELKQALAAIENVERLAKGAISNKAQTLYGNDWKVISGDGYKIGRQMSGALYDFNGEPDEQFVKVVRSIDSDAVTEYVKGNGVMPEGVALNPKRSEVIKITIKPE